jgi:hypothetical protein
MENSLLIYAILAWISAQGKPHRHAKIHYALEWTSPSAEFPIHFDPGKMGRTAWRISVP